MKLILIFLFLSLQYGLNVDSGITSSSLVSFKNTQNIENGWYEASVGYFNTKTSQRSNYQLDVKVESNRVTVINFGNGGSVHSGFNNSGYTYFGGTLNFQKDFNGQITSATTQVSIVDTDGTRYYDIKIQ